MYELYIAMPVLYLIAVVCTVQRVHYTLYRVNYVSYLGGENKFLPEAIWSGFSTAFHRGRRHFIGVSG